MLFYIIVDIALTIDSIDRLVVVESSNTKEVRSRVEVNRQYTLYSIEEMPKNTRVACQRDKRKEKDRE